MFWLDAVVFLAGAVVLVLEILGTRVIAPFYGSTVYVWSSLIVVTLASLTAGYAAGGALADRSKPRRTLAAALGAAGLWLGLLPFLSRPVLLATGGLGVAGGALASSLSLFAVPLACLGAVGPLAVRLRTGELARLGREVGRVSAISTAGSVVGALATGFVLVQRFAVPQVLGGLAVLLLLLAAVCRAREGGAAAAAWLLAAAGAGLAGTWAPEPAGAVVLARERSFYGDVKVLAGGSMRILDIDGLSNTVVDEKTLESTSDYITALELLPFLRPAARRALLIGLGGGSIVGRYKRFYGVDTDVVEIDPAVDRLARRWFGFEPTGKVVLEDGRRYLELSGDRYDFVVLDAFNGDHHPSHLFSREAFAAAARRLADDGVLAMNVIGYAVGPRAELRRSLERTLREVFPEVRVLAAGVKSDYRSSFTSLIFLASRQPLRFERDPAGGRPTMAEWYRAASEQFLEPAGPAEGLVLTDAFNPLETLGAPAFRELRRRLLSSDFHRATL